MKFNSNWVIIGLIVLVGIYILTTFNSLTGLQNSMKASHQNNQQIYSSIRIQMEEAGAIAKAATDKQIQGIEAAIGKRYGEDGVSGVMNWIQEENPAIDTEVYKNVQRIVEASYNKFAANQETLIDKKRVYEDKLTKAPSSFVAKNFGFTMEDIASYTTILVSDEASEDFQSSKMTSPNLKL